MDSVSRELLLLQLAGAPLSLDEEESPALRRDGSSAS